MTLNPLPNNPGSQYAFDPIPEVAERETEAQKQEAIRRLQEVTVDGFLVLYWVDGDLSFMGAGEQEEQMLALYTAATRVASAAAEANEIAGESAS